MIYVIALEKICVLLYDGHHCRKNDRILLRCFYHAHRVVSPARQIYRHRRSIVSRDINLGWCFLSAITFHAGKIMLMSLRNLRLFCEMSDTSKSITIDTEQADDLNLKSLSTLSVLSPSYVNLTICMCGPNAASLSVCIGCAGHLYASAALHCVSSCAGGTEARERNCAATAETLKEKPLFSFFLMKKMFFFSSKKN